MEEYEIQLIESVALIIIAIVLYKITQRIIASAGKRLSYAKARVKVLNKVVSTIFSLTAIIILALVWGIAPSQLATYVASVLTVLGIAFLAQWSILSNITATMIIFFNHQVKIGDTIEILDKDFHIAGKVSNIGIFFVIIKVNPGEYVSLPSNAFMQKMIKKINKPV